MLSPIDYPVIWLIIICAAIFSVGGLGRLVAITANRLDEQERNLSRRINIILVLWPVIAIFYAFIIGLDFSTVPPMIAIPVLAGTILVLQPTASRILSNIPLHLLIALGTYRVAGAVFLYAYYRHDLLSYGFAFNAGWGDVLTGALAPVVAYMVYRRLPGAFAAVLVWTVIGVGDLILAPISAALYGTERLVEFPLSIIPLFLGPPFGIILHIVTLRAAWLQRPRIAATALA